VDDEDMASARCLEEGQISESLILPYAEISTAPYVLCCIHVVIYLSCCVIGYGITLKRK